MFRGENCDIILKTANFHYEICAAGKNIVSEDVLSSTYNSFVRNVVTFRLLDRRLLLAIIVV